jgi:hypothetical protein
MQGPRITPVVTPRLHACPVRRHVTFARLAARIALAFALTASLATAAKLLPYEPAIVTLQGTLVSSDGMTPAGARLKFPAIRLAEPIAVPQDDPRDWPAEQGVVLLHMALDDKNMAAFKRLKGKPVKVTGTLFHADNGNHQTSVLVFPVSITPIN